MGILGLFQEVPGYYYLAFNLSKLTCTEARDHLAGNGLARPQDCIVQRLEMEPRRVNKTRARISMPTSIVGQNWERPQPKFSCRTEIWRWQEWHFHRIPVNRKCLGYIKFKNRCDFDSSLAQLVEGEKKITEIMELENFIGKRLWKWYELTSKTASCLLLRRLVFLAKRL